MPFRLGQFDSSEAPFPIRRTNGLERPCSDPCPAHLALLAGCCYSSLPLAACTRRGELLDDSWWFVSSLASGETHFRVTAPKGAAGCRVIVFPFSCTFPLDPPEKEMASHSSILPWKISWTEEPGGLQSTGSQRVRHD